MVAGKLWQIRGRLGERKIWQVFFASKCKQRTPAALPYGCNGSVDEIDGAIQHAPQPIRQAMV
jgi:hypothetical protein